jgi:septal ring factor EnvC (AmiA/AmiB activator)
MGDRDPLPDAAHFERLEALVRSLIQRYEALAAEHAQLRAAIKERDARGKALEAQLGESNQTRRDAAKRIDDLLSQLDRVEAEVGRRLEGTVPAA